jgi:hypothetical protein
VTEHYKLVTTLVRTSDEHIAPVTVGYYVQRLDEPEPRSDFYQWHVFRETLHAEEDNAAHQFTIETNVSRVKLTPDRPRDPP